MTVCKLLNISFLAKILNEEETLKNNSLKCSLMNLDYEPKCNVNGRWKYLKCYEVEDPCYGPNGRPLVFSAKVINNKIILYSNPVTWGEGSISSRYALIHNDKDVYFEIDFGYSLSSMKGSFTISFEDGLLTIKGE